MIGLDTNILVRFLTRDDTEQYLRVKELLEDVEREGKQCFINTIVLCELVWVLSSSYKIGKENIVIALEKLLQTAEFELEQQDAVQLALEDYRKYTGDFSDYLISWINKLAGCESTVTFDKSLKHHENIYSL